LCGSLRFLRFLIFSFFRSLFSFFCWLFGLSISFILLCTLFWFDIFGWFIIFFFIFRLAFWFFLTHNSNNIHTIWRISFLFQCNSYLSLLKNFSINFSIWFCICCIWVYNLIYNLASSNIKTSRWSRQNNS